MLDAHHDGSEYHLSDPNPELGDTVTAFVRVPAGRQVSEVVARTVCDGEPFRYQARVDRHQGDEVWWRVDIAAHNPVTSYRFHLRNPHGTTWLNGAGEHDWDVPDAGDFRLSTEHHPPGWQRATVWYQVFPDRFSRRSDGEFEAPVPNWATAREWHDPVRPGLDVAMTDLWGGSLNGVADRLDYLESLGVNGIYTCPVFPARSNHRYDASSFDRVDPLLGGDQAMRRLTDQARARGMRVMGDLTTNHTGDHHDWFRAAVADPDAGTRDWYLFDDDGDYEKWLDVASLPKLDQSSAAMRARLYEGPDSVAGRDLSDSVGLSALRIDVANMTGRHGASDLNSLCSRGLRATIDRVRPDAWLLAEHGHDATLDLDGRGWHGTMNYAGFTRPVWTWLRRSDAEVHAFGESGPLPRRSGPQVARSARAFQSQIPYSVALSNMNLLGSHDSARWAFAAGKPAINLVGLAMLCTWPGSPSILYGDEIGLGSDSTWDVTTRLPFPWHDEGSWDTNLRAGYRRLIELRRGLRALAVGGMRWLHVGDDALVWVRESRDSRVLVHLARGAHEPIQVRLTTIGASGVDDLHGAGASFDGRHVRLVAHGPTWSITTLT